MAGRIATSRTYDELIPHALLIVDDHLQTSGVENAVKLIDDAPGSGTGDAGPHAGLGGLSVSAGTRGTAAECPRTAPSRPCPRSKDGWSNRGRHVSRASLMRLLDSARRLD